MSAADVLRKAAAVLEDRSATHGVPEETCHNLSVLWSAWLQMRGDPSALTPRDCAAMLIMLKLVRECNTLNKGVEHRDNWIDMAGYAAIGGIL
jgi:hypothetical protein